jgi:hypothetical protein
MNDQKAQLAIENAIAKMGFRPKRIRVPFIVRNKSQYEPHQGLKERQKALKRIGVTV